MASGTIRLASPRDAAAIAALTREAYRKWIDVIGREPLPMQVDYVETLRRHRFDLMEIDGVLVGLIETTADDDGLLIVNLAVRPAFQGRGHGRCLLQCAERLARSAGMSRVRLYTNKRFVENIRFYERAGYLIEREAALNGGVAVYMGKLLSAGAVG